MKASLYKFWGQLRRRWALYAMEVVHLWYVPHDYDAFGIKLQYGLYAVFVLCDEVASLTSQNHCAKESAKAKINRAILFVVGFIGMVLPVINEHFEHETIQLAVTLLMAAALCLTLWVQYETIELNESVKSDEKERSRSVKDGLITTNEHLDASLVEHPIQPALTDAAESNQLTSGEVSPTVLETRRRNILSNLSPENANASSKQTAKVDTGVAWQKEAPKKNARKKHKHRKHR